MTYMAVEQAAFVSGNPFRLLEVFNRHFKLKERDMGMQRKGVQRQGWGGGVGRDRREGRGVEGREGEDKTV